MKLETLLNKLIELGWKPFGEERETEIQCLGNGGIILNINFINLYKPNYINYSLNDLCSIDSGLWQFVVDKELVPFIRIDKEHLKIGHYEINTPEYRLMLSSIQENKEKFILDNIVI